jgi:hypothetical protein
MLAFEADQFRIHTGYQPHYAKETSRCAAVLAISGFIGWQNRVNLLV